MLRCGRPLFGGQQLHHIRQAPRLRDIDGGRMVRIAERRARSRAQQALHDLWASRTAGDHERGIPEFILRVRVRLRAEELVDAFDTARACGQDERRIAVRTSLRAPFASRNSIAAAERLSAAAPSGVRPSRSALSTVAPRATSSRIR